MAEPVVRQVVKRTKEQGFSDEVLFLTDAPVPGRPAPRPSDEIWTETVTGWSRLEALQGAWQDLAASAAEPNPFYEPWMLLPALRSFAAGARVEVLLVFRGPSQLCGLFPVLHRRGRAELWRHPYCYLSAPLVRQGCEGAVLAAWLDALAAKASVVRLEDVPGDGPIRKHLVDALHQRGWPSLVSDAYTRAVLRRAPSAEHFLAQALAGKRRKELRRQRARLSELGRLATDELAQGADPLPWIDEFLALEAAGWKGRDGVAALPHRTFMADMAKGAARQGRLQMLALRLDGKPVALKLNLFAGEGESAFAFKITFDESYARFSPGVLLELDNVERAHQLPALRWMDSCAAPNRFMINHLWPDRREMQTVFFATGSRRGALTVALVPLLHFFRRLARAA
ncbi:MAG TPA: GNAT family N-acetyltransferase [Myxococcales bacterium]|jgi:CelD/BcsL family acetyltransferase involved in cellulose biosynthesis|nr:GNAT family N-acetyltransferase [Myxococcales bacterium]